MTNSSASCEFRVMGWLQSDLVGRCWQMEMPMLPLAAEYEAAMKDSHVSEFQHRLDSAEKSTVGQY
jgi:hypothetical protein